MSRLPVQLGTIEVFAEAGRLGSFKRAAESLSYTTSAVSQAVRKLEDRLGCALFERCGNRVKLTQDGELLLGHVEAGLTQIRQGVDSVRLRASAPLSLSTPPGIASQLLPSVISILLTSDITDVRFVADEQPDFSSYKHFDVAILYGEQAAKHHDLERLGPDVFVPVCRPDIAEQLRRPEDVLQFPLLVNETNAVSWDNWLRLNGVNGLASKRVTYNRAAHIIPSMINGAGIGLESLRLLSPQIASGALVIAEIPRTKRIVRDLTYLYVTQEASRQERAEAVAQIIREHCTTDETGFLLSTRGQ